jgi:hypothetical protein
MSDDQRFRELNYQRIHCLDVLHIVSAAAISFATQTHITGIIVTAGQVESNFAPVIKLTTVPPADSVIGGKLATSLCFVEPQRVAKDSRPLRIRAGAVRSACASGG